MKERNLKISVVTVCYNAVDVIEETIQSVVKQTYDNIEYIIIDGGSTDGTVDTIKKYQNQIAFWVSEPDKGIYDAMNKGIDIATGDYINFMNAGDTFYSKNVLKTIFSCDIKINKAEFIYGNTILKYQTRKHKIAYPKPIKKLEYDMPICHQSCFINLSFHKKNKYDTRFKLSADYALLYKAYKTQKIFIYINQNISNYRAGEGASFFNYKKVILERQLAWNIGEKVCKTHRLYYLIARIYILRLIRSVLQNDLFTKS